MKTNPLKNKFWEISCVEQPPYIPDDDEIAQWVEMAQWVEIEELQAKCKHLNWNEEDGCIDCGYDAK